MKLKNPPINASALRKPGVEPATPAVSCRLELIETTDEQRLNKTERAWLEVLRIRGTEVIGIQSVTLKLGDDCRYTPDFYTVQGGALTFWEVKGFMRDDALVKLKVAARTFSWARFVKVERIKGQWIETPIRP